MNKNSRDNIYYTSEQELSKPCSDTEGARMGQLLQIVLPFNNLLLVSNFSFHSYLHKITTAIVYTIIAIISIYSYYSYTAIVAIIAI